MSGGLFTKLAQQAVEHFSSTNEPLPPPSYLPAELTRQRACYVSIFEKPGKQPRARHGSPLPLKANLAEEIIFHATEACRASARPLRRGDFGSLGYEVAILGPLERIGGPEHLNPMTFGLYVQSDQGRATVLLPQRTGIETAEDQVATALREIGLNPHHETYTLYRFSVAYFE